MLAILILFFPIIFDVHLHYDMNRRKCGFGIYAYKIFKIIGGYIATYAGGLAMHISDKKALLIPYTDLNNERKRFSFVRFFRLQRMSLTIETGADYLFVSTLGHMILRAYYFIIGGDRAKMKNNLLLVHGDELRIGLHCALLFNLWMVICSSIKFLKEKIQFYVRKTSKNQQFN